MRDPSETKKDRTGVGLVAQAREVSTRWRSVTQNQDL